MRNPWTISTCAAALVTILAPGIAAAEMLSTPAEQAQTRSLNQGSQGGIYTSTSTLNGQQGQTPSAQDDQERAAPVNGNQPGGLAQSSANESAGAHGALNPNKFIELKTANPESLDAAPVLVASGETVGRVQDVDLGANGTPSRIQIVLQDGRAIWVSSAALRFNPTERLLLTNLNQSDLDSMATRQGSSSAQN